MDAPGGRDGGTDAARTAVLVERAQHGDQRAFGELYDEWFDRVHDVACRVAGDRAVGAEVAQDAFLRAWRSLDTLRDPQVFGGWLLRITRNAALNRRRSEARTTAVDSQGLAMIEGRGASPASGPAGFRVEDRVATASDPADAVADAEVVALLWDAVGAMTGRDAEVLDLGLRQGLSPAEIGEAIGMNRNAANQAVHRARRRLRIAVEARVLWRDRTPDCPELAQELRAAGVESFGAAAVPVAETHARSCARCEERRRLRLEPAALFGAVPIAIAPVVLKAKVAAALAAEGVPMAGSSSASAMSSGGGAGAQGTDNGTWDIDVTEMQASVFDTVPPRAVTGALPVVSSAGPDDEVPRSERSGRRRAMALAVAAIVLLLVLIGAVGIARSRNDDPARQLATGGATTSSSSTSSSSTSSTSTTAPPTSSTVATTTPPTTTLAMPATTRPVIVPPPAPTTTVAPTTTTTSTTTTTTTTVAPPPVDATLTMTPATRARPWTLPDPNRPRLTWTTAGAASVTVVGPSVNATSASGDVSICPNLEPPWSTCNPAIGEYAYTLTARNSSGAVVLERTVTLTVT